MNEKLKKILDALYRNPNDFQQACEKELCDPRIPDSSNFVSFLANKRTAEKNQYFELIDNNFQQTTSGEMDEEAKAEINELAATISAASVSIPPKDYAKPKVAKILEKESKNLDKTTQKELLANFNAIAAENENSFSTPIIATFLVTLAKSKKLAKPEMTKEINKFYSIASKLILASAPKHKLNNIQDAVLDQIKESFGIDSKEYTEMQRLLNNAVIRRQLSSTATDGTAPCHTNNDHGRILRYYQNGSKKLLIINNNPVEPKTSIEDAIKTFDLNDNSNFLKYALDEIDKKVREVFNKNNISDKCIIPATEAIFLTLCYQLEKEVGDNVLFAISDPLSDMLSYSPFNEEILTAIKDICKEISGKEVEFGESDKKSSDETTPAEGHEHNHPENNTTTDSDEVTKPAGNPPVQNGPAQSLVKLPSKLAVAKLQKYAAEVLGTHGVFVGASGKAKYKNATPEQKNIIFQVNNAMLLPKKVKTITSKIVKNKTPSSYLDEDVDPSAEEIVSKLANVLAEIYSDHKSKLEELRKLQAEINKEPNEAKRNKLKTKFESKKEAYRAATNKEGLMKELKRRINNEVFRTVKAFGDDYSDNYK